jgi:hypothetical protein
MVIEVLVDIGSAGERIVEKHLRQRSYATSIDLRKTGSTIIRALGRLTKLLVEVRTAVSPDAPTSLSADDVKKITSLAAKIGYEAWEARVQIDSDGGQLGKIIWTRLG